MKQTAEEFFEKTRRANDLKRAIELNDISSVYSMMEEYAHQKEKDSLETLRDKFYDECVDNVVEVTNGITHDHGETINMHPHNLFEWFKNNALINPQTEKEEVESGWVIVDPEGKTLTDTFYRIGFGSCVTEYSGTLRAWKKKVEKGYKCKPAERVTRLKDTTK